MIRTFTAGDLSRAKEIHAANGLDERCFPNLTIKTKEGEDVSNPLFVTAAVYEHDGKAALMGFLKITSEAYLLIDHTIGTPEERWAWLQEGMEHLKFEGWKRGLEQITCFVPPEIEESFAKRLIDLGFQKSPWQSYTLNLEE